MTTDMTDDHLRDIPPVTESNGFGRTSFIELIFDGILVPNAREADQNEMPEVLSRS
jgi:hypothetical protein